VNVLLFCILDKGCFSNNYLFRQQASRPTVHLAAALAAEAGTVARAVAEHAQHKTIDPSIV